MNTLQANTHSEESVHFSDLVIDQLCALILKSACSSADSQNAQAGFAAIESLAKGDQKFAEWMSRHIADLSPLPHVDTEQRWDNFLSRVIALNASCSKTSLLKNAASVTLRLRTLERAFDGELDRVKLRSIYQLAYGLSHELNNPLANITVRANVLLNSSKSLESQSLLETIIDNASRGSEMLGDLMLIANPPALNPNPTDLKKLGEKINNRCRIWTEANHLSFSWQWQLDGTVMVDGLLINEVIWVLVRNAIEASSSGQSIVIEGYFRDGSICVHVEDEGQGVSDEVLQYCFDLFYSGREAGRGLGIGLTKAKRLASLHGGDVTIVNLPIRGCRAGCCFKVCE